jgi:hypothetical protein
MYQIAKVKTEDLSKVTVKNQDKIMELTGRKLDPSKAFQVIKNETKGFTVDSEKAKKADRLFADFLKKNGIEINETDHKSNTKIRLQEQERARALDLLELELKLAA